MDKKITILVADDDDDIRDLIEIYLTNERYNVILASNGAEVIEKLNKHHVDLIILDIMMPVMDGIRTCLKIRESKKIPIIILSAKSEDSDKILGLNIGADDYITKPFNPLELVARVKSQIRRYFDFGEKATKGEYVIDSLTVNLETREVFIEDKFIRLTPTEFLILELLLKNRGRVLSTEKIYENVWNEQFFDCNNTVAAHIRNLREKIESNPKNPQYIKLVWGVGYKIDK